MRVYADDKKGETGPVHEEVFFSGAKFIKNNFELDDFAQNNFDTHQSGGEVDETTGKMYLGKNDMNL